MFKKFKLSIIAIYISLIIPLTTTYLLSILQRNILGENKSYYHITTLNISNCVLIIISILIIISTYFICSKKYVEIIYYIIGIIVSFISKILPLKERTLFLQTFILRYILIIGYAILIFILFMSLKFKKWDNNCIKK